MSTYYHSTILNDSFDDVIEKTTAALAAEGFGILTEIDVAATLKKKLGVDMPAYRILGVCNPGFAYKALQAEKMIGTMLPCNVIVREDESGAIEVAAVDPIESMQAIENERLASVAKEVRSLLRKVIAGL